MWAIDGNITAGGVAFECQYDTFIQLAQISQPIWPLLRIL